ncbi:MAG: large conductance mechanosensitive channel protein MscL [Micrococcales bacterium]|nr:large conductance mechanosensitive channel protein MscL [Micrococcales bacterium]
MITGFKEFILRGNVVDLAVGVVIGAAFGAVVNALVTFIFNPLVGALFQADSLAKLLVVTIPSTTGAPAKLMFGALLAALIQFLLTALVIYLCVVFPLNRLNQRVAARLNANQPAAPEAPAAPTQTELLAEIRDLLQQGSR